ncbi:hypothetical protein pb186bvf_005172 [Paramecium bursaria]
MKTFFFYQIDPKINILQFTDIRIKFRLSCKHKYSYAKHDKKYLQSNRAIISNHFEKQVKKIKGFITTSLRNNIPHERYDIFVNINYNHS